MSSRRYGVIVVGAGHAGIEAAAAAARMGERVALITLSRSSIGEMPCNPAMGGVGKGHLMAELDALGGIQAWAADRAGIQFKVLNRSKGTAVWGPRAQCDKARYSTIMRRVMEGINGIEVYEDEVLELISGDGGVEGVITAGGRRLLGDSVVLTTGTFLSGILHTGMESRPGGRFGEQPSVGLGASMRSLGLSMQRFKTGTPPRLSRRSIELASLEVQEGDRQPRRFSWRTRAVQNRAVCWITRTGEQVQRIIEDNLDSSPLYTGRIEGVGPRYCPSIEDKVVRFPHHREHTVFLEPEGLHSDSIYLNGVSTSLAREVQERVVSAIPGLEHARIIRYGYAVEYDVVAPRQITMSLQAEGIAGLYLAGQLLGTSGYEEAAALGFVAGVNAVLEKRGHEALSIGRDEGYIGVLLDDVVRKEHSEPYRMMTSRAEHRIVLGVDSARERLMERGVELGLVKKRMFHVEQSRWLERRRIERTLECTRVSGDEVEKARVGTLLGRAVKPGTTWANIVRGADRSAGSQTLQQAIPELSALEEEELEAVLSSVRYRGYRERHERERERVRRLRDIPVPAGLLDNLDLGLSREVKESLQRTKPRTLAEAELIPGITPAAIAIIAGWISRSAERQGGKHSGEHGGEWDSGDR